MAAVSSGRSAPPPRSNTPTRSGTAAPIRLLRICLDERVLGAVEINESSTLSDVRQSIAEDEISGVPDNYQFLFGGAPVSLRQEGRRRATSCFPFLVVVQADARIPPPSLAAAPTRADLDSPGTPGAGETQWPDEHPPSGSPGSWPEGGLDDAARLEEDGLPSPEGQSGEGTSSSSLELQVTDGPLEGTALLVGHDGARIGRHTTNTLVVPEAGISRFHCEVAYIGGEFCVRDMGSTTGTFFYLKPHGNFHMFVGLMVKLGETEMEVLAHTPANSAGEPELVVLFYEGPLAGHKVRVPPRGITIGRSHDNTLVLLQDGTVSAHHAMMLCQGGEFYITDLGSCNGTCVRLSGERAESTWHPIMDGDVLGAGCTKIRCRVNRTMHHS